MTMTAADTLVDREQSIAERVIQRVWCAPTKYAAIWKEPFFTLRGYPARVASRLGGECRIWSEEGTPFPQSLITFPDGSLVRISKRINDDEPPAFLNGEEDWFPATEKDAKTVVEIDNGAGHVSQCSYWDL